MIIGIDYSINSPGLCILNKDGLHFGTLARTNVASQEFFDVLERHKVWTSPQLKYSAISNSTLDAQGFTIDAIKQATELVVMCKRINQGKSDIKDNVAVFEGFSFGSKGNRLAQLAGYQYVARADMISNLIDYENLFVYSPQSIKSIAGAAKRGEGKKGMIQQFIEHEDKLPGLIDHPFYKEMAKDETSIFRKKGTKRKPIGDWIKPVDDIIDAYWIVQTYFKKNNIDFKTL